MQPGVSDPGGDDQDPDQTIEKKNPDRLRPGFALK